MDITLSQGRTLAPFVLACGEYENGKKQGRATHHVLRMSMSVSGQVDRLVKSDPALVVFALWRAVDDKVCGWQITIQLFGTFRCRNIVSCFGNVLRLVG